VAACKFLGERSANRKVYKSWGRVISIPQFDLPQQCHNVLRLVLGPCQLPPQWNLTDYSLASGY
jgi:hypothetical protein